jgi:hypothetical protein
MPKSGLLTAAVSVVESAVMTDMVWRVVDWDEG